MISGHRRLHAAKRAKLSKVPAIVMNDISDDEATIVMVDNKSLSIVNGLTISKFPKEAQECCYKK